MTADAVAIVTAPRLLWIGGSMHTAHMLREAGADAIHDGEITPEQVKERHCIIAPSGVKRDPDAAAERDARRALRLGAQSAAIIPCRSLNGAADVADWLEQKNRHAVDLNVLADKAQPIQEPNSKPLEAQPVEQHLVTDTANAKRIAKHFAGELAYAPAGWHVWDGTRWALDDDAAVAVCARVGRIVMQEAAALSERAATESDGVRRKIQGEHAAALMKFSANSENIGRIMAAKTLAQSMLKRATEDFDADPLLVNCINGVVDLRTSELLPHDRDLRLTKLAGCDFDPEAKCLTWLDFLADVFSCNAELVNFAQRLIGYFLTGLTREDVLAIFYGTGANGKTTLLKIVMAMMGEYARPAPAGLFDARHDSRDDQRIAVLWGRRLVVGQETDRGARLPEAFIKNATSSDRQSGRHLYGEPFDFTPTHKLVLATNHRPRVSGTDYGIWRRLLLVPFGATFRADAGNLDPRMPEKLTAELEGVLAWAVKGALEWQRDGLKPPALVRAATEAYRQEEDVVAQYVDDRATLDPRHEVLSGDVYRDYTAWCEAAGTRPLSQRGFVDQLAHLGVKPEKGGKGRRFLTGIRLKGGAGGASRPVSIKLA